MTVRMQARDRFGNATAWKRWQTLAVSASGPQEVVFRESPAESGRGVFVARLSRAGAYVVWCTVGGQAVVGWPRVIQVVPGNVDSDASVWRAEAETMALASDSRERDSATSTGASSRDVGEVGHLRAEAAALKARLAKYEEAAAVVMEAAEASGVTLKQHARAAAYNNRQQQRGGGSGSRRRDDGNGNGGARLEDVIEEERL